ncbi:MAG: serine hydrolase, partial [Anaerolineae bacterium]|nr:serine hydrolase [Gemmatimonadaceae bacterium]
MPFPTFHVLLALVVLGIPAQPLTSSAQTRSAPAKPTSLVSAQDSVRAREIDRLLRRYAAAGQFNGAVLVARRGATVYSSAFGLANMEQNAPNTLHTKFQIASITKTFTAMLVLRLVDRGKLDLNGKVRQYLPDYPSPAGDSITIEQLLTHTAGIPGDIGDFPTSGHDFPDRVTKINGDFYTLDELIPMIAARPALGRPGSAFRYSSDGYAILGAILAKVAGKAYEEVLRDEILRPLGMTESGYVRQTALLPGRASGYRQTFGGYENSRPIAVTPAGGMYSTVGDLLKLDRALFSDQVMSARAKTLSWQPTSYVTSYGWQVRADSGASAAGAIKVRGTGALPGFNSYFTRTLSDSLCVILLVNTRDMTFRLDEITEGVLSVMRGRRPREPQRSVAQVLAESVGTLGIEPAISRYETDRRAGFKGQYLSETELNSLGYHLLTSGRTGEAIRVFALNVEAFPNSANTHDSLGEAYMTAGDRDNAIRHYERSITLDPNNANGVAMLRKLRSTTP